MRTRTSIVSLLILLGASACGSDGKKDETPGDGDGDSIDSGTPGDGDGDGDGDVCDPAGAEMYPGTPVGTFDQYSGCFDLCGDTKTQEEFDNCVVTKCEPGTDKLLQCLTDNQYACETAETGPNSEPGPCRDSFVRLACCDESSGCSTTATSDEEYLACLDQKCPTETTGFQTCRKDDNDAINAYSSSGGMGIAPRCLQWIFLCFEPIEVGPDAGTPDGGAPGSDAGVSDAGVSDAGVSDAGAGDASVPPPPHVSSRLKALMLKSANPRVAKRVRTAL
jgi:hypothetical protein